MPSPASESELREALARAMSPAVEPALRDEFADYLSRRSGRYQACEHVRGFKFVRALVQGGAGLLVGAHLMRLATNQNHMCPAPVRPSLVSAYPLIERLVYRGAMAWSARDAQAVFTQRVPVAYGDARTCEETFCLALDPRGFLTLGRACDVFY